MQSINPEILVIEEGISCDKSFSIIRGNRIDFIGGL